MDDHSQFWGVYYIVYQCTVSVIIPRYTVFGRILVTLILALDKAKVRNTRPRPRPKDSRPRPRPNNSGLWLVG